MKIFVTGGAGAIGRPLIAELLAGEHDVVALTRSPEQARALREQGVEPAVATVAAAEQGTPGIYLIANDRMQDFVRKNAATFTTLAKAA